MKPFTIILKNNRSLLIFLIVIFIFNLFFLYLPLLNVFGFEFSLANSIILFFVSGTYIISYFKKLPSLSGLNKSELKNIGLTFIVFLVIPLIVSLVYSSFTMICSLKDGFLFYLVITVPSVILGSSVGLLVFTFFRKFRILIFIVVTILIIAIPLFEFYFNPQVYFFNPVFGFFPGTIYDEGIKVTTKLVLYRLLNLVFFAGIILLVLNSLKKNFPKIFIAIYTIVISVLFFSFSPVFGFSTTNSSLQKELSLNFKTAHFSIYFSTDIPNNLVKEIALEHEYDYTILTKFFELRPQGRITSYVFDSSEQKGKYFGSVNADVAKPWLKQIYVSADSYDQTLRHELAHVFTANFGTGIFKVAAGFNPAMIEGAAVAAAPFNGDNTIHYMAKLAYQNGYKIKIEHLFRGLNFFGSVSSLSYIYAGSFSKFLIDNFGVKKFEELYSNLNFKEVYNEPVDKITHAYYSFLDSLQIEKNINKANYYYGRQTIFQKVCPRYVGERLTTGRNYFITKNYVNAENIFREILQKTNNYSALIGLSSTLVEMGDTAEAAKIIKTHINKFVNTAYFYNLEFRLADLEVLNNNFTQADSLYKKLSVENPNRLLYNLADLRLELSKDTLLLKHYLTGTDVHKFDILKKLNSSRIVYSSIPVLVILASSLDRNYSKFITEFGKKLKVENYTSSYAMYKLSKYMMDNLDFTNAREIAKLSMNYKTDENFNEILRANFEKANWFYYNADGILDNIK